GELSELVLTSFQFDPVGERSVRGHACGVGDASQGSEHAAGEKPPSHEAEHDRNAITMAAVGAKARKRSPWVRTMKITPGCAPRDREKYPTASSKASSHARARSSSALTTPPSAATRTSSTANWFLVSAT